MLLFLFNKKRWIFTESVAENEYKTDGNEKLTKGGAGNILQTPIQVLPVAVAASAMTMPSPEQSVLS